MQNTIFVGVIEFRRFGDTLANVRGRIVFRVCEMSGGAFGKAQRAPPTVLLVMACFLNGAYFRGPDFVGYTHCTAKSRTAKLSLD